MEHIKADLVKRLNQRSLGALATAAHICHVANQWAAGRFVAVSFHNGVLTLAAPSSGAAHNLRLGVSALTEELSTATKQQLRLRIIVRAVQESR